MTRTFIYGSCVSRDTFERLPSTRFELVQYVARQSLISAAAPSPRRQVPAFETPSAFQERMLLGDWEGSLLPALREHAADIDLLLWDLCDERLGLRQVELSRPPRTHAYSTRSVDGIRAGVDEQLRDAPLVPFASLRHRLLFFRAVRAFVPVLDELDLLRKVVVLAPAWAGRTDDGTPTPSSFGLEAPRANRLFDAYHSTVEHVTGVPVVRLGPPEVLAAQDHPWGPAPFHYTEGVYDRLTRAVVDTVTGGT